jgi:3-dehydroquinate dehydratase II
VKVLIINGPNLNFLGTREPEIYGDTNLSVIEQILKEYFDKHELEFLQFQNESDIVMTLHDSIDNFDGIVLNAGAFAHTSVAIRDAVKAIDVPVVETHISNIFDREYFRSKSLLSGVCIGNVSGFGIKSYAVAISSLLINRELWNNKGQ